MPQNNNIANVCLCLRDWKESIDVAWLQKSMANLQANGHRIQLIDGEAAAHTGGDDIATVMCPAGVNWQPMSEDACDIISYDGSIEIHVTTDGTRSYLIAGKWMTEQEAIAHINAEILKSLDEAEQARWEKRLKHG
jgi:hypothetical protein